MARRTEKAEARAIAALGNCCIVINFLKHINLREARGRNLAGRNPGPTVVTACLWPKPQQLSSCTLQELIAGKANSSFQSQMELACSNTDIACLFQALR